MALILHQSNQQHSHGGLSGSHSHGHSHKPDKNSLSNNAHGLLGDREGQGAEPEEGAAARPQANASVRSAFVHVLGDLLQSISVLISAIIIFLKPEYKIADPICTFLFSIFVVATTVTIMRDILLVLMEGVPGGLKYSEVRDRLLAVKGVKTIHNLHISALTMNQVVVTAHVAIDDSADPQQVLREMTQSCYSTYNFHSVTIQIEQQADQKPDCTLCLGPDV